MHTMGPARKIEEQIKVLKQTKDNKRNRIEDEYMCYYSNLVANGSL